MGTVPFNFPPERKMDIGQEIITGTLLGTKTPFANTVFFTAPTTGLYSVAAMAHIVQTDGAGNYGLTLNMPNQQSRTNNEAVINDTAFAPRVAYCPQGSQVTCSLTLTGAANTTFNIYVSVQRTF